MTATLYVRTTDGWTTEHADPLHIHVEGDELVYERETELLGRHEVRLGLDVIRWWKVVAVYSGLER